LKIERRAGWLFIALIGVVTSAGIGVATRAARAGDAAVLAQAMMPPTGMTDEDKAMAAAHMAAAERMRRRFPQAVRVGDLIGLRVIDNDSRTLGYIREVVRTPQNTIALIVDYGGWFGWGARPVAVPIEVVGIAGREVASLDMPPSDYAAAPTWHDADALVLQNADTIRIALARR
jgi:hypothetical protein